VGELSVLSLPLDRRDPGRFFEVGEDGLSRGATEGGMPSSLEDPLANLWRYFDPRQNNIAIASETAAARFFIRGDLGLLLLIWGLVLITLAL